MRRSGSVCLDVINQTWSPMYDLKNIFEVFLPQLLTYPNPTDPLNGEAAALQMREPERYQQKVKEYVQKYARPEDFGNEADDQDSDYTFESSDDEKEPANSQPSISNNAPPGPSSGSVAGAANATPSNDATQTKPSP